MSELNETQGPGPLVLGQDRDGTFLVRPPGDAPLINVHRLDARQCPIHQQWAAGTPNGLIATWPNRAIAQRYAEQHGTQLMQVVPLTVDGRTIAVLADEHGQPLEGTA